MEEINFAALAPRQGTKPMIGAWSNIGTCEMNGGAFNWGSLFSGLKMFGNSVKNLGTKAWNSSAGQALKQKLKDTNLQEKIVEGISSGIHGAVDIANQQIEKAVQKRLEAAPPPPLDSVKEIIEEKVDFPKKRMREEDIEVRASPPSYEELFGEKQTVVEPVQTYYTSKPVFPSSNRNWQATLNNIVGVGLNFTKKRRCY
ncbi:pVI [Egyptian fruit bat adenovirus]|uniref:PVI n=1 Tax=Egyptian fruit bat adenovirus TaxID=2849732 RepID=A0A344X9V0_9ADEN|nr:pVI [Rousettus aegyptiacus adenovirus]AXE75632.1 pVI [Egyptian fruit bat adenovirus]